eukprot:scaffold561_cov162-Amphora_coffeaeformis.AAC.21
MESLFGKNRNILIRDLEEQVEQALQLFDEDTAKEYREALHFASELIKSERPTIDFLLTEDFHVLRAAHRLALYWKVKKQVFGERWLNKMSETGSGTLRPEQVELLRTGFQSVLTSPQAVSVNELSRLPEGVKSVPVAILFYLLSVATCELAQTEGFTMLLVINGPSKASLPTEMACKVQVCLPSKFKPIIMARSFDPTQNDFSDFLGLQRNRCFANTKWKGTLLQSLHPLVDGWRLCSSKPVCWLRAISSEHRGGDDQCTPGFASRACQIHSPLERQHQWAQPVPAQEDDDSSLRNSEVFVKRLPDELEASFVKRRHSIYGKRSKGCRSSISCGRNVNT